MSRKKKPARPTPRVSRKSAASSAPEVPETGPETELRIIGGYYRGRKLAYHGNPVVRPMKHRTREAIFDLISTEVKGRYAIDLFAGTGALGLEAISRGATGATFIEKHVPSARVVSENIAALGVEEKTQMMVTSAFVWGKRDLVSAAAPPRDVPWVVFCSPPYAFFVERLDEVLELIDRIGQHMPPDSIVVVESDERLDFGRLTAGAPDQWDVRHYPPAVVGIWRSG